MTTSTLRNFKIFVKRFDKFTAEVLKDGVESVDQNVLKGYLDGSLTSALQSTVSRDIRRANGIFFTNVKYSKILVHGLSQLDRPCYVFDPACGTGNLLLACASKLPLGNTLASTLRVWGKSLGGMDIEPLFVEASRIRLTLLAACRGRFRTNKSLDLEAKFPGITTGDSLSQHGQLKKATHIIANPPFQYVKTGDEHEWAKGNVSQAAVFVDHIINNAKPDSRVSFLLPDVLRSGSRYERWRDHVAGRLKNINIRPLGIFDDVADVHVFRLAGYITIRKSPATAKWMKRNDFDAGVVKLKDLAHLHVGPVVPHRDPVRGIKLPYIDAKGIATKTQINYPRRFRRARSRSFVPPFIVILRTSRPEDSPRIKGVIVNCEEEVHVENHLIVIVPKPQTLKACKALLKQLKSEQTTRWLNQAIRCRHLTVRLLKDLPVKSPPQ